MSSHNDSFIASGSSPTYDFIVEHHGTILLLQPLTPAANSWIEENLPEDRITFGSAVAVEHRFFADIVRGAQADGSRNRPPRSKAGDDNESDKTSEKGPHRGLSSGEESGSSIVFLGAIGGLQRKSMAKATPAKPGRQK